MLRPRFRNTVPVPEIVDRHLLWEVTRNAIPPQIAKAFGRAAVALWHSAPLPHTPTHYPLHLPRPFSGFTEEELAAAPSKRRQAYETGLHAIQDASRTPLPSVLFRSYDLPHLPIHQDREDEPEIEPQYIDVYSLAGKARMDLRNPLPEPQPGGRSYLLGPGDRVRMYCGSTLAERPYHEVWAIGMQQRVSATVIIPALIEPNPGLPQPPRGLEPA